MKRCAALLLSICLLFLSATACAQTVPPLDGLYQSGLEAVGRMSQLASDPAFCKLFTSDENIVELLSGFAGLDYANPKSVYQMTWNADSVLNQLENEAQIKLTPLAREVANAKLGAGIASQINAFGGATLLAASSILAVDDCLISSELERQTSYLYLYDNQYGAVVVFTPYGEGIVKLNATFVMNEALSSAVTDVSLLDLFAQIVPGEGIGIAQVTE